MQGTSRSGSVLLRLFWALVGHAIIYMSLAGIAVHKAEFPAPLDAAVWITVAAMLVARRLDIVRYGGQTLYGEPATLGHFRRFALLLVTVTAAASVMVHALASQR